jgi:hypothetical protein
MWIASCLALPLDIRNDGTVKDEKPPERKNDFIIFSLGRSFCKVAVPPSFQTIGVGSL